MALKCLGIKSKDQKGTIYDKKIKFKFSKITNYCFQVKKITNEQENDISQKYVKILQQEHEKSVHNLIIYILEDFKKVCHESKKV